MQRRAAALAAAEHWRLLAELDALTLYDSCCEICHCDCYSSHRSSSNNKNNNNDSSNRQLCVYESCEQLDSITAGAPLRCFEQSESVKAKENKAKVQLLDNLAHEKSAEKPCCSSSSIGNASSNIDAKRGICIGKLTCEKVDLISAACEHYDKQCESVKTKEKGDKVNFFDNLADEKLLADETPCCYSTSIANDGSKKRASRKAKSVKLQKASHKATKINSKNETTKHSATLQTISIVSQPQKAKKSAKQTTKTIATQSERASPTTPAAHSLTGTVPKRCSSRLATVKRSKSVCSLRSRSPSPLIAAQRRADAKRLSYNARDCKILQDLLSALDVDDVGVNCGAATTLKVSGKSAFKKEKQEKKAKDAVTQQSNTLPRTTAKTKSSKDTENATQAQKLCASMVSLCLAPTVRAAFEEVPAHDKRILNRMAHKRSERVIAKENAWLARKYWENERYERELLKCTQAEEYKRAIRDKQFQDYLLTKARLTEIAERDLSELQRLREALDAKDANTKRRLDAVRLERGIAACQRRCDELRRAEAVTVQQESQHVDEKLRKQEICMRLGERMQRAEQLRNEALDAYLRRLRYDNYMEELVHGEQWREAQHLDRQRRAQLLEHIEQKREQSQRFIEARQRRKEAITRRAKIAASLRELVRQSVTPDGDVAGTGAVAAAADGGGGGGDVVSIANTAMLSKVLLDRPFHK